MYSKSPAWTRAAQLASSDAVQMTAMHCRRCVPAIIQDPQWRRLRRAASRDEPSGDDAECIAAWHSAHRGLGETGDALLGRLRDVAMSGWARLRVNDLWLVVTTRRLRRN